MKKETQPRHKYTDAMIKKLPTKNNKYYVLDSECIGLRIYVQVRTGAKAFYLQRYLKEFGYSKKTKIGDFPEMSIVAARKLGGIIKADNVQGKDPIIAAAERAKEKTFGAIVAEYILKKLDSRTNKTRAAKNLAAEAMNISAWITGDSKDPDVRKVWRKYHDQLNIKSKQLSKIKSEDIMEYHAAVSYKTTFNANRMVQYIRKIINWSKAKGYYDGANPAAISKNKLNAEIKDHLDYYSSASMFKIITAAKKLRKNPTKRVACNAILAALYCGGRPQSECFNLTIDQYDLDKKLIHYKESKVGQWERPITDTMINHIKEIEELRSKADPVHYYGTDDLRHKYLFPNCRFGEIRRGNRGLKPCKLKHVREVRKLWKEIKQLAGVEDRDLKSLRHTFAVFAVSQGVSLRALQKMLGHSTVQTTEIYAAAAPDFLKNESDKISKAFDNAA